jgi:phosphoglucomutase
MEFYDIARDKALKWLAANPDQQTKKEIERLLNQPDPRELVDNFYKDLEFGTGGLRGIMGAGSNCMNRYTVGAATQGFANYLLHSFAGKPVSVAIAHDSRNQSRAFAEIAAEVFSANGIEALLFAELRPTPLLSFAVRYLKCQAGLVITASHNPKEYNGYKAYWSDGAQLVPPHDQNVIEQVSKIQSFDQIRFDANPALIRTIGPEVENAYYEEVKKLIPRQESIRKHNNIPIVYSSIHGSGITMVPRCLELLGFTQVHVVEAQRSPDGNFPTVQSPNPEEQSAMRMALDLAVEKNAELVMATDPDTDRVGIGIQDATGKFFLLNGNQAFSLMMWFILKNRKPAPGDYIAKTIVTTELVDDMARHFGVTCHNTLTGFKYIAELMRDLEGKAQFVAAGEESYGYMVGDFVRDKDAVSACAFFAAMAAAARHDGQTLYQWLLQMYTDFGFYKESLINLVRKGAEGEQQIKAMMRRFREQPPAILGGSRVVRHLDYMAQTETNLATGEKKRIALPQSDVLQFYTDDGSKISVRPSGTEPKIKFYISVRSELPGPDAFAQIQAALNERLAAMEKDLLQ